MMRWEGKGSRAEGVDMGTHAVIGFFWDQAGWVHFFVVVLFGLLQLLLDVCWAISFHLLYMVWLIILIGFNIVDYNYDDIFFYNEH